MDLSTWFTQTPTDRPVAWVNGQLVSEKTFFHDAECFRLAYEKAAVHRVALFCQDTYRFACALFGAWQAGVLTVLPTDMTEHTQEKLLSDVDAFVFDEKFESAHRCITPVEGISDITFNSPLDLKAKLVELFTSGSTGEPLRIEKRLEQIFDGVDHLDAHFSEVAPQGAIVFSTVSHQHIYGFLWRLLWPIASGRLFTNERLFYPETIAKRLSENKDCLLVTSPAHLQRFPETMDWQAARSNLKMVVTSGGPLSDDGLRLSQTLFSQTPYEIFGSTELDGIAWRHRRIDQAGDINEDSCLWHPMPETEVEANEDGILQVRSARLEKDQWTLGNDRIDILPDRRFRLIGRVDRIAKVAEKRVSLTAMEKRLTESGLIAECKAFVFEGEIALVAVPNDEGQKILSDNGKRTLVKKLREALLTHFEAVMLPHRWRFEPMMPFDQRGKCTLEALSSLFDPRHLQPVAWHSEANTLNLTFVATTSNPHFDGHFEEFHLLPGVAQIEYVMREAHRYLKTPLSFKEGKNMKFMQMIRPGQAVEMRVEYNAQKNTLTYLLHEPDNPESKFAIGTLLLGD